ncbi:MAG TPA: LysM peptidoglycan-binding domain-containing protein [Candidatus Krumholzibacteria bacterium]|nr:LysM peptidoglycan-binding domain-containing protein [Candidatus Krumholzibacteria bacterium]HRX50939.1 LysM peptidoglycan-binding domain-containing protein [Candidatus Krumholzibacteria bacterium]
MRRIFRIVLSCMMLCCLGLMGCSSTPARPDLDPARSSAPVAALADSAPMVTPVRPAPTSDVLLEDPDPGLAAVLADRPDLAELDGLWRQALELLAQGQTSAARDLLFLLRAESEAVLPADSDPVAADYLGSLRRRTGLLAGVVAEEEALHASVLADDSLLTAAYAGVRGLSLPDSLIPIAGERRRDIATDLLQVRNEQVERWIRYFSNEGKLPFTRWLERKSEVDSLIYAELDRAGLPRELIYLSAIESGFVTGARSGVGAVGPWQFMAGTARHFKLRCDWWVDERRDFASSTEAAATYLSQLYHRFGDWALVLAAYNTGEFRVERAVRLAGHDNFWKLHLPAQTRNHIPKFIAAAEVGEHPERYGIEVQELPDLAFDVVPVVDATDLDLVAECAGVPASAVRALNPGLLRRASPPGREAYPVKVPQGTAERARRELASIPVEKRLTWRRHTVQRGETLGAIARTYGTTVKDIAGLNRIADVAMIRPGDRLLIPMPKALAEQAASRAVEKGHYVPPEGYERVTYNVKKGDTLGGIARKLGVTLQHLRQVNNMHGSSLIKPGQRMYAYRPGRG